MTTASFDLAIPVLLKAEGDGQISRDPHDPGGVTKYGISKRSYPTVDIENLTREDATDIYKRDWWLPTYDQIKSQTIATKLLVLGVNMGTKEAIVCLQRALRATDGRVLVEDGQLGFRTMSEINMVDPQILLAAFKSEAAGHYRLIDNPAEIAGWLNRAYS